MQKTELECAQIQISGNNNNRKKLHE